MNTVAESNSLPVPAVWDRFAHEDACRYIMTGLRPGDQQAFWKSGEKVVDEELLSAVREHHVPLGTALEIGCGVGRLMFPLSRHFQRVVGVDISPQMVRLGRDLASQNAITNTQFFCVPDPGRLDPELAGFTSRVDFLYSWLVFQHIEDFRLIKAYLQSIGSLLSDRGIAYLQFDTRRQSVLYVLKNNLPDSVLPRFLRRGIRRIRRTPVELEDAFARAALEVVRNITSGSEYHRYVLRKATL